MNNFFKESNIDALSVGAGDMSNQMDSSLMDSLEGNHIVP
jgi:hypothetical protein